MAEEQLERDSKKHKTEESAVVDDPLKSISKYAAVAYCIACAGPDDAYHLFESICGRCGSQWLKQKQPKLESKEPEPKQVTLNDLLIHGLGSVRSTYRLVTKNGSVKDKTKHLDIIQYTRVDDAPFQVQVKYGDVTSFSMAANSFSCHDGGPTARWVCFNSVGFHVTLRQCRKNLGDRYDFELTIATADFRAKDWHPICGPKVVSVGADFVEGHDEVPTLTMRQDVVMPSVWIDGHELITDLVPVPLIPSVE